MTIAQKIAKTAENPMILFSRIGSTQHEITTEDNAHEAYPHSSAPRCSHVHYIFKDGSEIIDRRIETKHGEVWNTLFYRNKPSSNRRAHKYAIFA